jgi:hypothetical protein
MRENPRDISENNLYSHDLKLWESYESSVFKLTLPRMNEGGFFGRDTTFALRKSAKKVVVAVSSPR